MEHKILIADLAHLERVSALLNERDKFIAVDVETTGLDYLDAQVVGLGLANQGAAWYIDFMHLEEQGVLAPDIWPLLRPLLDTERHVLIGHHSQFDLYFLRRDSGVAFANCANFWDTLQMAALVDENLIGVQVSLPAADGAERSVGALSLKALSHLYLGRPQRLWDEGFMDWPLEERVSYGCDDVRNTYDLAVLFSHALKERGLLDYYIKHVAPQVYVAEHMERQGIRVDVPALQQAREEMNQRIAALETQILALVPATTTYKYKLRAPWTKARFTAFAERVMWELPVAATGKVSLTAAVLEDLAKRYDDGRRIQIDSFDFGWADVREKEETPFNHRSRQQLGEYLVSQGCRLPATPSGQYSTSEESLAQARQESPDLRIWEPLVEIQKLEKMRSVYIDGVLAVVWPEDSSVHPEWNIMGTTSGRYSCSNSSKNNILVHKRGPALQTIPNPERLEEEMWTFNPRAWYVARPEHVFLVADLAQAEVRMLAVRSQCPVLRRSILKGGDLHAANAETIWPEAWCAGDAHFRKVLRTKAKTGTFGVIYGIGPMRMAEQLHISIEEARDFLDEFYDTFYGVTEWKEKERQSILKRGYSETYLGRRRTPVIIQKPPRVTAHPHKETERFQQQQLMVRLWEACWDLALRKGKLDPQNATQQELEERAVRQCINHCIQGSVGELINWAAWRLVAKGYRVVLQMHDELVVEVPNEQGQVDQGYALLKTLLEQEIEGVPFVCDVSISPSWSKDAPK